MTKQECITICKAFPESSDQDSDFALILKSAIELGVSKNNLAETANVSIANITSWTSGLKRPSKKSQDYIVKCIRERLEKV